MKIREGFVSNSSSSSFIVLFDKIPESSKELEELLFGGPCAVSSWDESVPSESVCEYVLDSMRTSKEDIIDLLEESVEFYKYSEREERTAPYPLSCDAKEADGRWSAEGIHKFLKPEEIRQLFLCGMDAESEPWRLHRSTQNMVSREMAKVVYRRILEKNKKVCYFHLSDNDGTVGQIAEHGNIFDKITHVQISQH